MNESKKQIIKKILGDRHLLAPQNKFSEAFAPSNIALCKYWGKRNIDLNLPVTSSLSISLGNKGVCTRLTLTDDRCDTIKLNHNVLDNDSAFAHRVIEFLDLFRGENNCKLVVDTCSNIPVGAGLASSAAGFAALSCALDKLFGWQLTKKQLSILSRLGSGSACRSLWNGFVKWNAGVAEDGMDSFAEQLPYVWPDLTLGLLSLSAAQKKISSRHAMCRTVETSRYYKLWPQQVAEDMQNLVIAIKNKNFNLLGATAEQNAIAMHALCATSKPAIIYSTAATISAINNIWQLRDAGINVYFTQDAGANLVLLFLKKDINIIKMEFDNLEIIPFGGIKNE